MSTHKTDKTLFSCHELLYTSRTVNRPSLHELNGCYMLTLEKRVAMATCPQTNTLKPLYCLYYDCKIFAAFVKSGRETFALPHQDEVHIYSCFLHVLTLSDRWLTECSMVLNSDGETWTQCSLVCSLYCVWYLSYRIMNWYNRQRPVANRRINIVTPSQWEIKMLGR